jgi:uncharacterized protein
MTAAAGDPLYNRGASFPLAIGPRGGIEESRGSAALEASMRVILGTRQGERAMRPDFGCNLGTLVFAPNNESTANLARHYAIDGLTRWEPRIEVMDVRAENDNAGARLVIHVLYRVRSTQETGTLVYPFNLGGS